MYVRTLNVTGIIVFVYVLNWTGTESAITASKADDDDCGVISGTNA
jgi:hypothetical protein